MEATESYLNQIWWEKEVSKDSWNKVISKWNLIHSSCEEVGVSWDIRVWRMCTKGKGEESRRVGVNEAVQRICRQQTGEK